MPIFRCLMRGENFPFNVDGTWKSMGFYATRFVDAASEEEAEFVSLDMLRVDPALARDPSTPGLERARLVFEEIEQVGAITGPNAGFTLFDEDAS